MKFLHDCLSEEIQANRSLSLDGAEDTFLRQINKKHFDNIVDFLSKNKEVGSEELRLKTDFMGIYLDKNIIDDFDDIQPEVSPQPRSRQLSQLHSIEEDFVAENSGAQNVLSCLNEDYFKLKSGEYPETLEGVPAAIPFQRFISADVSP